MSPKHKKPSGGHAPDWHAAIDAAGAKAHVMIADLRSGDLLTVVTKNHTYTFRMLDADRRTVEMTSDHPKYAGPMTGYLIGCLLSAYGSTICAGRVSLDLCAVFVSPDLPGELPSELRLSPTREIRVNGIRLAPHEGGDGGLLN